MLTLTFWLVVHSTGLAHFCLTSTLAMGIPTWCTSTYTMEFGRNMTHYHMLHLLTGPAGYVHLVGTDPLDVLVPNTASYDHLVDG